MFKKVKRTRAFVCLLVMFAVLLVWGFAENAVQAPAADGAAEATVEEALDAPAEETLERDLAAANGETDFAGGTVRVIEAQEDEETTQIDFVSGMTAIWESTGLANGDWQQYVMILVAFVLLYLAIVKGFEPLLLLPISFGMLLANLPLGGLMDDPTFKYFATLQEAQQYAAPYGKEVTMVSKMFWDVGGQVFTSESAALAAGFDAALPTCTRYFRDLYQVANANGGLFYYLYQGVKLGIYPPLIFMGGTAGGVLLGKLMCKLTGGKINPLIGSAGVSAVPMAARVSQKEAQRENPGNFLLMHAMGPNVAGVIGSAVAAGVFIALFG